MVRASMLGILTFVQGLTAVQSEGRLISDHLPLSLLQLSAQVVARHNASLVPTVFGEDDSGLTNSGTALLKVKAFYVSNRRDKTCMQSQLERYQSELANMNILFETEPWARPEFRNCQTASQCAREHPQCFPNGVREHLWSSVKGATALRALLEQFCAQGAVLRKMERDPGDWDYFMIIADDTALLDNFPTSLRMFLDRVPPLWTLTAFDVSSSGNDGDGEKYRSASGLPVWSLSEGKDDLSGGQAWLLSTRRLKAFAKWFQDSPAAPLNQMLRAPRLLHHGMIAYNPGVARLRAGLTKDEARSLPVACSSAPLAIGIQKTSQPLITGNYHPSAKRPSIDSGPREVIVLGMYDTGTNLVLDFIRANLEKPNHVELCRNYTAWAYCGAVWKHTHPRLLSKFPSTLGGYRPNGSRDFSEAVAVVMLRHPFSLMRSLQRQSYEMKCQGPSDWLEQPCDYIPPDGQRLRNQKGMPRMSRPTCVQESFPCWPNFVQAWNSYTAGYLRSLHGVFRDTVFVRYEDLVENPDAVLKEIAQKANVVVPPKIVPKQAGAKYVQHVESPGLGSAREKLSSVDYGAQFSLKEVSQLCSHLDKSLMLQLGYQGCEAS